MRARALIDAGPLVSYLIARDQWHDWAVEQFKRFPTFATCDAVLAEACARLAYYGHDQSRVIDFLVQGAVTADFSAARAAARISKVMKKYASRPMDFADACLVVMTEQVQNCVVVTLDAKDFSVYRRHEREVIPFLSPCRA
jgi:predicted nucleic acid-binding protein